MRRAACLLFFIAVVSPPTVWRYLDKKKLSLNKDTVRKLDDDEIRQVEGGGPRLATYAHTDTGGFQTICPRIPCCAQ